MNKLNKVLVFLLNHQVEWFMSWFFIGFIIGGVRTIRQMRGR